MDRARWWMVIATLMACAPVALSAQPMPSATLSDKPLSQRWLDYNIDARVNAQKHTIDATEILTWHNFTGKPQDTFPFHLYLNAFQPKSTFIRETHLYNPDFEWKQKNYGAAEVKSLEVVGVGDLTAQIRFISPDDGNPDDRTVFQVKLPKPVPAGGVVQFKIVFHDELPEVFARTGYKRDFIMGAQWFPKIGMWWQGAWNCHQFHRDTEFFAEFGTFEVKLTLPQNEVVGASGVEVSSVNNPDGTKTVSFYGEDIHDFAWTAEPEYQVVTGTFQGSMGAVKIRILVQPGHMSSAPRYLQALEGTLDRFDKWYGPYPYKQITLVDPPHGALQAGGMEYPTLFTADTTWWAPKGLLFPEDVTEHEFGHQYWYGMVATNEFENAWMDEGINSYTEVKIMDSLYGKETSILNMLGAHLGASDYERLMYSSVADDDPMSRVGWQYMNGNSYGGITYGKTATVLRTLEKVIGEQTMQRALHTYFMRYRFTHPTPEDFLKTVEEVSGKNLRWYYDQAVYGTEVMDYEVLGVRTGRQDWYQENRPKAKKGETVYYSTVLIHRKGDFIFPVDVQVKFDNGETVSEHWDGRDRWVRYQYDKKAKVVSAELDPGHQVWLDKDFFNNSYARKSNQAPHHKLAMYWTVISQWCAQLLAWLV
ncbi:MAG TPA: M1 family metallopeptidase [Terriglobales bacterium]|nr:M1 family metallopeptidase [Terriglobales bacterium]